LILFFEKLKHEFPVGFFTTEPSDLEVYGRDWTKVHQPNPSAVCFPSSTDEVSRLLRLCSDHQIAVVPSGGRTGLAGGAVAANGEVVVSLTKMRTIGSLDRLALTLQVEAGVVTEAVHEFCSPMGLTWPIDFASKGSSTVGGNIATNAGGVKVIRYGLTRNWVLGLTVVLMSGEVLRLNGSLEKNNTGVDLRQLFIGTEGVFGIITECILKLSPLPGGSEVFLFALNGLPSVFRLFEAVRKTGFVVNAFECFSSECLSVVLEQRSLSAPFFGVHDSYVLLEVERPATSDGREQLEAWLSGLFESELAQDAVLAQNPKEAQNLWAMREGISESLSNLGLLHKHDISLPIHRLQEFIETWTRDLAANYQGLKPYIFGHVGDGNLHVNLLKPESMGIDEFRKLCAEADQKMFGWIQQFEGSVSAEHGIGLLKKHLLRYSRTEREIEIMRGLKAVLDPQGLMNPGKIF
jgi:FAD/FMN-containing dehydrogenase